MLTLSIIFYNLMPLYLPLQINDSAQHKEDKQNLPSKLSIGSDTKFTIAQLNLNYNNPNLKALIPVLGDKDFDLLVLQEASDIEYKNIKAIGLHYPYSFGISGIEGTPSGMAIFSRWPIIEKRLHPLNNKGGNILEVILQIPTLGTPVQVFAIHPSSPRTEALWRLRNKSFTDISEHIINSPFINKIVVGDFNSSPWNYSFKALLKNSQLKNSAQGFGYIPSWSYSEKPFLSLLSSAYIDHNLISDSFSTLNKSHQLITGSDHLLLLTELSIRNLQ